MDRYYFNLVKKNRIGVLVTRNSKDDKDNFLPRLKKKLLILSPQNPYFLMLLYINQQIKVLFTTAFRLHRGKLLTWVVLFPYNH